MPLTTVTESSPTPATFETALNGAQQLKVKPAQYCGWVVKAGQGASEGLSANRSEQPNSHQHNTARKATEAERGSRMQGQVRTCADDGAVVRDDAVVQPVAHHNLCVLTTGPGH